MNLVEQVLFMKNMKSKFKNNFIFYKKINHLNILEEKIPFKIKRPLPNGKFEMWTLDELTTDHLLSLIE